MTKTSDKIEFNEAQAKAWPTLCSEIAICVEEEHSRLVNVPDDPNHYDWHISQDYGYSFEGFWHDGDFLVHFRMDRDGEYSLGIAELDWFHTSSTNYDLDECRCAACYPSRVQNGDEREISNEHAKVMDLGDDPLDPHGDGTIQEGDPFYRELMEMLKTGEPVAANRREDGLWDVEVPVHRPLPEITPDDSDLFQPLPKRRRSWWARFKEWLSE